MVYVVSCVSPQNHQDPQGQNLHQLPPRRVSAHSQGAPSAHHLLARRSGPGSPGALAGSGSPPAGPLADRKSTRLNSSHLVISYAVFCLKKKKTQLSTF